MKKNLLVVFVVIVSLSMGMVSCSKQDDNLNVPVANEQVKIFMSKSDDSTGLKSASTSSESYEIADGDTVDGIYDIHTLFWAKRINGQNIEGVWDIQLVASDYINSSEADYSSALSYYRKWDRGDQIATKFIEHGLYKITFGIFINYEKTDILFTYYVRIGGVPGKVGDGYDNDYIFRMEKKTLFNSVTQKDEDLIFLYFKYSNNPNQSGKAWIIMNYRENGSDNWIEHEIIKWPFSKENYYYVVIPAHHADYYRANFAIKMDPPGQGYFVDLNNHRSSWSKIGECIYFTF